MTSVKSQWTGNCWAFAAVANIEALVNLYYNRHLNLDLSEHEITSCVYGSSGNGGWPYDALNYIRDSGIIDEEYYPNPESVNKSCDTLDYTICPICDTLHNKPEEEIKITSVNSLSTISRKNIKKMVLESPVVGSINATCLHHSMLLTGYSEVSAGDRIYYVKDNSRYWIDIEQNDSLIGKTYWIFKNSWGKDWGDNGYGYIVLEDISLFYSYIGGAPCTGEVPIESIN